MGRRKRSGIGQFAEQVDKEHFADGASGGRCLCADRHRGRSDEQRKDVERDYAMHNGVLKLKVRKAMEGYLRDRLGLAMSDCKPALRLLE